MHRVFNLLGFITSFAITSTTLYAGTCKPVYLTFDSGNMRDAVFIRSTLKQENVKATFFITNKQTLKRSRTLDAPWADFWKTLVNDGHVFGNHTWSHHYARYDRNQNIHAVSLQGKKIVMDKKQFCKELSRVDTAFFKLTGTHLSAKWRAPAGRVTQQSLRWAAECGYPVHVHWTRNGYLGDDLPSERYSNQYLLEKVLKSIQTGEILLMHMGVHDRKQSLAPVLPRLIRTLKKRNYCFYTLGI
jgi:peptidoglycan/xylan/chitin deacetylase (PgdA/CDA1 family)